MLSTSMHFLNCRDIQRWYRAAHCGAVVAVVLAGCGALSPTREEAPACCEAIARTFTVTRVDELGAYRAFHFALRAWRATGESRYETAVTTAFVRLRPYWYRDICGVTNAAYASKRAERLAKIYHARSNRYGAVAGVLATNSRLVYYKSVLFKLSTLRGLGLLTGSWAVCVAPALEHLRGVDFTPLLSDDVIAAKPAQVANLVWYLQQLGIDDQRDVFIERLQRVYSDTRDAALTRRGFGTKTYALTHIIISESEYYQRPVERQPYEWILTWFERQWPRIRDELSPDIVGEVALCFVLCGRAGHPLVAEAREIVLSGFDAQRGYITRRDDPDDVKAAEHRNAVAFLLLNAPQSPPL
jgi:hypothetical protein